MTNRRRGAGTDQPDERDTAGLHLDVRGKQCPDPLVEILRLIDLDQAGDSFTVDLDQEPLFLYPELDARGWRHDLLGQADAAGNGCRLRLSRRRR